MGKQQEAKVYKLPSNGLVHSPGMVENYRRAIKIDDTMFKKMFEHTYFGHLKRDAIDEISKTILDGKYTTDKEGSVFVYVNGLSYTEVMEELKNNNELAFARDSWGDGEIDYCFLEYDEQNNLRLGFNADRDGLTYEDYTAFDWVILK